MTLFADSSALVKRYADEAGADVVRRHSMFIISDLARVEVPAALWRKQRVGTLGANETAGLVAAFERDLFGTLATPPIFMRVAVRDAILDRAARLCGTHGLRAYDAVQLATAVAARAADPGCDTFAAFDNQLREAAAAEGFRLAP